MLVRCPSSEAGECNVGASLLINSVGTTSSLLVDFFVTDNSTPSSKHRTAFCRRDPVCCSLLTRGVHLCSPTLLSLALKTETHDPILLPVRSKGPVSVREKMGDNVAMDKGELKVDPQREEEQQLQQQPDSSSTAEEALQVGPPANEASTTTPASPVLVFLNSASGGKMGPKVLEKIRALIPESQ